MSSKNIRILSYSLLFCHVLSPRPFVLAVSDEERDLPDQRSLGWDGATRSWLGWSNQVLGWDLLKLPPGNTKMDEVCFEDTRASRPTLG